AAPCGGGARGRGGVGGGAGGGGGGGGLGRCYSAPIRRIWPMVILMYRATMTAMAPRKTRPRTP
ncbi:MAG: hypothetical protein F4W96_07245, partial [Chloroflexi bacterium]|nr:hypothetical protein [Chloroflexota bacterium]